jgi:hypothetical protein
LEGDTWAAYFRDFQRSAWRLELLPQYLVPQEREAFAAYRAGAPRPPRLGDDWCDTLRAARAEGKTVGRVHVVTPPLSEYLRFETQWFYPYNVAAGEDVRILDLSRTTRPIELPNFDFWLFDDERVVAMLYENDGTQTGRELLEGTDPAPFLKARDAAIAASIPFTDYRP